jgi:pilus assembly protein CpaD
MSEQNMREQNGSDTMWRKALHLAALGAILLAGSCAGPSNDGHAMFEDPAANHPITVSPSYQSLKVNFSAADAGLLPDDAARFTRFVENYRDHGNGAISISVPAGSDTRAAAAYFAGRIAEMGIARNRILVATHDVHDGDMRVELDYMSFKAGTAPCGDWSRNLGVTWRNQTDPNFGCAVQHNIAAMVANPRDLIAPRDMEGGDAVRRATVLDNYEQGKPTAAQKTADQSGAVSDVGKQ